MRLGLRCLTTGVAAGALFLGAGAADAGTYRPGYARQHRDFAHSKPLYDAVGQVTVFDDDGDHHKYGSGILLNRRWVLTAAHLLEGGEGDGARAVTVVFEHGEFNAPVSGEYQHGHHPDGGGFPIDSHPGREYIFANAWYTPKQFSGTRFLLSGFDIALIDLGPNAITGSAKFPRLAPAGTRYGFNKEISIVGVGIPGSPEIAARNYAESEFEFLAGNFGNYRRGGTNILDGRLSPLIPVYPNPDGPPPFLSVNSHYTVFDFDNGANGGANPLFDDGVFNLDDYPTRLEYNTALGDSGAPIFWGDWLVGIAVGGYDPLSGYNDLSINAEVSAFTNWIRRVMTAVQRNDNSQPWLYRRNSAGNPLFFEEGAPFDPIYARSANDRGSLAATKREAAFRDVLIEATRLTEPARVKADPHAGLGHATMPFPAPPEPPAP